MCIVSACGSAQHVHLQHTLLTDSTTAAACTTHTQPASDALMTTWGLLATAHQIQPNSSLGAMAARNVNLHAEKYSR